MVFSEGRCDFSRINNVRDVIHVKENVLCSVFLAWCGVTEIGKTGVIRNIREDILCRRVMWDSRDILCCGVIDGSNQFSGQAARSSEVPTVAWVSRSIKWAKCVREAGLGFRRCEAWVALEVVLGHRGIHCWGGGNVLLFCGSFCQCPGFMCIRSLGESVCEILWMYLVELI